MTTMLEWKCHICKEKRPDSKISVHARPVKVGGITVTQNVRYCNDRPACVEGAKTFSFF